MKVINPFETGARIIKKGERLFYSHIYDELKRIGNDVPVIKRAKGPYLYDFDQNRYLDFYMAGGNLLMGHIVPQFTKVIKSWFNRGYSKGYPFLQSSRMLVNRLSRAIDAYGNEDYLAIFFNSSLDAFAGSLRLLRMIGLNKGRAIANGFAEKEYELFGINSAKTFSKEDAIDFLILNPTAKKFSDQLSLMIDSCKNRRVVTISDERDFPALYYQYNSNKWIDADIRILGSWISSGYDFGGVFIKKSILPAFYKMKYSLLYYLDNFKLPPLYKIKGAIKFLGILEKKGGIEAIVDLQNKFFDRIENSYFEMQNGLIFVNGKKIKSYDKFWNKMLKYGYFFPYDPGLPIFISLGYDIELIKKVAKDLNQLASDLND